MELKNGTFCPLLKKECIQNKCAWFTLVRGKHSQTGKEIDDWLCAVSWLPTLILEGALRTRQVAEGVTSFRNEMVEGNKATQRLMAGANLNKIGGNGEDNNRPG